MTRAGTLLTLAALLAGCASGISGNTVVREAWQGAPYEEVIARWGAPLRSAALNDGRFAYTWLSQGIVPRSSVWPSIGVSAGSGMGVGIGIGVTAGASRDVAVNCERTLIFSDNRVVDQTWQGPADFCSEFRRR